MRTRATALSRRKNPNKKIYLDIHIDCRKIPPSRDLASYYLENSGDLKRQSGGINYSLSDNDRRYSCIRLNFVFVNARDSNED